MEVPSQAAYSQAGKKSTKELCGLPRSVPSAITEKWLPALNHILQQEEENADAGSFKKMKKDGPWMSISQHLIPARKCAQSSSMAERMLDEPTDISGSTPTSGTKSAHDLGHIT